MEHLFSLWRIFLSCTICQKTFTNPRFGSNFGSLWLSLAPWKTLPWQPSSNPCSRKRANLILTLHPGMTVFRWPLQQVKKAAAEYLPNGRGWSGLEAQEAAGIKEFFTRMKMKCQRRMMRSYLGNWFVNKTWSKKNFVDPKSRNSLLSRAFNNFS